VGATVIYVVGFALGITMTWFWWWVLPILATLVGFTLRLDWKKSFHLSVVVALVDTAIGILLDQQQHGLITKRVGGVFSTQPFVVFVVMMIVTMWQILFFSRMGRSLRYFVDRTSKLKSATKK
jgi:hypothetical protein